MKLPYRVVVKDTLAARYQPGSKPVSWDERVDGFDVVKTEDGSELTLLSSGAQSTPAPGWELLLTDRTDGGEYRWTLYGIRP